MTRKGELSYTNYFDEAKPQLLSLEAISFLDLGVRRLPRVFNSFGEQIAEIRRIIMTRPAVASAQLPRLGEKVSFYWPSS